MKQNYKFILLNTLGIFLLSFLCHFIYDWFPNSFTTIFFPVNESIWEHVKMLFTTIMIWGVIEYFIYKRKDIPLHNFFITLLGSALLNIVVLLILYLPTYYLLGEHMILTFIILLASIFISQWIIFKVNYKKEAKILNTICIIGIPLMFCLFGYLTYHPIKCDLFFDPMEEKYGLSTLNE